MPRKKKDPIAESGKEMFEKARWGAMNAIWIMLLIFVVFSVGSILAGLVVGQANGVYVGVIIAGIASFYIYSSNNEFKK